MSSVLYLFLQRHATSDIYSNCKSLWIIASAKLINVNLEVLRLHNKGSSKGVCWSKEAYVHLPLCSILSVLMDFTVILPDVTQLITLHLTIYIVFIKLPQNMQKFKYIIFIPRHTQPRACTWLWIIFPTIQSIIWTLQIAAFEMVRAWDNLLYSSMTTVHL